MPVEPLTVFGGWRMARTEWTRTLDGHECDYDTEGLPATVFDTEEACRQAIEELGA